MYKPILNLQHVLRTETMTKFICNLGFFTIVEMAIFDESLQNYINNRTLYVLVEQK